MKRFLAILDFVGELSLRWLGLQDCCNEDDPGQRLPTATEARPK